MIYSGAEALVTETASRIVRRGGQDFEVPFRKLRRVVARTLASEHYVHLPHEDDPVELKDDYRRLTCEAIRDGAIRAGAKLAAWREFVFSLCQQDLKSPKILMARLQSRLMVNMAGGVLENGGLCLDRTSGVPYIPGSAVKGCARRTALAELRDATNLEAKASLFETLAWVFGWSDVEWKDSAESDFAFACGDAWPELRKRVASELAARLGLGSNGGQKVWEHLPHFAGDIVFLPAYPWEKDPGIELDVVTGHHGNYYQEPAEPKGVSQNDPKRQKWKGELAKWEQEWGSAPDTEEPNPVVFPAVSAKEQPRFVFVMAETPRAREGDLAAARGWLAVGVEAFGIGAKTNAGYGWFVLEEYADEALARQNTAIAETKKLAEAARDRARTPSADPTHPPSDLMPPVKPDAALIERFAKLNENDIRSLINKFCYDEKFWPTGEEAAAPYQLSLFVFLTEVSPALYNQVKGDRKSKMLQGLAKIAAKNGRSLPS